MDLTEALDFIRARKQGVLATIRANGRPQLSNILYVPGDDGHAADLRHRRPGQDERTCGATRGPRSTCWATTSSSTSWSRRRPSSRRWPPIRTTPRWTRWSPTTGRPSASTPTGRSTGAAMVADRRLLVVLRPERAYGMVARRADDPVPAGPRLVQAGVSAGVAAAAGADPPLSDSSTSWERSSTRTSSSLSLARTASSSMIMQ